MESQLRERSVYLMKIKEQEYERGVGVRRSRREWGKGNAWIGQCGDGFGFLAKGRKLGREEVYKRNAGLKYCVTEGGNQWALMANTALMC